MARFFTNSIIEENFTFCDEDAKHISRSLRMKIGDKLTLCDGNKTDYLCEISEITALNVIVKVIIKEENIAECPVKINLFQGIPKGDKMDYIVQKSVELGASEIIPFSSSRCIGSFLGKEVKKVDRLNKISLEAAKQSGRGVLPEVKYPMSIHEAVKSAQGLKVMFYENAETPLSHVINQEFDEISILIGPEGGFSSDEVELAKSYGFEIASLGPRILRTETASISALAIITYEVENK